MIRAGTLTMAACAGLVAGLAGYLSYHWLMPSLSSAGQPSANESPAAPATLPDFALNDVDGRRRSTDEWRGRLLLVNFWATWCAPCRDEIPGLVELQRRYGERGLQVIGIAVDRLDPVRQFAAELGINYPLLIGEADAIAIGAALGNDIGALPYTVIADRQRRIVFSKRGVLDAASAGREVAAALGGTAP